MIILLQYAVHIHVPSWLLVSLYKLRLLGMQCQTRLCVIRIILQFAASDSYTYPLELYVIVLHALTWGA